MVRDKLPAAVLENWAWQDRGACRSRPDLFFSPDGERDQKRHDRELRAKAVCYACPVMAECRAHALNVGEPYGVWGALAEHDRHPRSPIPAPR